MKSTGYKERKTKHPVLCTLYSAQGFSLVEVLVAILILATGLVMVIEAMGRTQHALRISKNLMLASQLAEEYIVEKEMLIRQDHTIRSGSDRGVIKLPGRVFDWERNIGVFRSEGLVDETKLNQVDVNLKWSEGNRKSDLQISTILMNREKEEQ